MSDGPFNSPPIVLGENCFMRKARKEHRCFGRHMPGQGTFLCGSPIFKGSQYVEYVGESAAYQSGKRFHVDCARTQGLVTDAPVGRSAICATNNTGQPNAVCTCGIEPRDGSEAAR